MRRLKGDWISEYVDFTSKASRSCESYHWWCAVAVIGAALKRNCFIKTGFTLFPNMYTILVGRPGIGKGEALGPAIRILRDSGVANVLSDRLTVEFVLSKLADGFVSTSASKNGSINIGRESSAILAETELSVFLRDSTYALADIAKLWDSEDKFDYGTIGKGLHSVEKPCFSILGGTSPEWLHNSIPKDAAGGGFTRRVNFVYSKTNIKTPWVKPLVFSYELIEDLKTIHANVRGEFTLDFKAKLLWERNYMANKIEDFDDEATAGYKSSKPYHDLKIAMTLSAARNDSRIIEEQDIAKAHEATSEVLKGLAYVFRSIGESDSAGAADKVLQFIETKGYASRNDIMKYNWRHVGSVDQLESILRMLVEGRLIQESSSGNKLMYKVIP